MTVKTRDNTTHSTSQPTRTNEPNHRMVRQIREHSITNAHATRNIVALFRGGVSAVALLLPHSAYAAPETVEVEFQVNEWHESWKMELDNACKTSTNYVRGTRPDPYEHESAGVLGWKGRVVTRHNSGEWCFDLGDDENCPTSHESVASRGIEFIVRGTDPAKYDLSSGETAMKTGPNYFDYTFLVREMTWWRWERLKTSSTAISVRCDVRGTTRRAETANIAVTLLLKILGSLFVTTTT